MFLSVERLGVPVGVEISEESDEEWDSVFALRATTFDNPSMDDRAIKGIFSELDTTMDSIWRRHYIAAPPQGGAGFFRNLQHAARATPLNSPVADRRYVAGLDIGRKEDETVLIIKDRRTRHSVYAMPMSKRDWTSQREAIVTVCNEWHIEELAMDASSLGGNIIYDELAADNLPARAITFTNQQKYNLWTGYALALERGTVAFPEHWTKLVAQLEAGDASDAGGSVRFRQIDGGHDDWLDAEMLALSSCDPVDEYGEMVVLSPSVGGVQPINANAPVQRGPIMATLKARRAEALLTAMKEQNPDWAEQFESGVL